MLAYKVEIIEVLRAKVSKSVAVFNPGAQHSYETAKAFQDVGMLAWYATEIFYRPDRLPYRALRCAPRAFKARLESEAKRRFDPELRPDLVRTFGKWQWAQILMQRLGLRRLMKRCSVHGYRQFAKSVGRLALREGIRMLWGFHASSLEAFRLVKREGISCVLDQAIAHTKFWRDTVSEERERHPEFADAGGVLPDRFSGIEEEELDLADAIACGSDFCAKTLIDNGVPVSKIRVIPYGVDVEKFVPTPKRNSGNGCRLLFVGGLCLRKGAAYLLLMMRKLKKYRIGLTVVGHNLLSDRTFKRYADVFRHVKHVPHGEMRGIYDTADVYVLPSLVEGSSLTIYEALASGLPVVTTPNSGSVVRDGVDGFIVPAGDLDALCERVEFLARSPDLRHKMGQNARERACEFTWKAYHRRVVELANGLLGRSGVGGIAGPGMSS